MCKNHGNDGHHHIDKKIEIIQEVLDQKGMPTTFLQLEDGTENVEEMAQILECEVGQIIKASLFKTAQTQTPILVLASSPKHVNEQFVQTVLGERVILDTHNVAPILGKERIETFIDADLVEYPELWASAGIPNIIFSIEGDELQYLTGGKLINIR